MPGYDWRDDSGTVVPSRSGYHASPSGRGPDTTPSRDQGNQYVSSGGDDYGIGSGGEFGGRVTQDVKDAYVPFKSSVTGLKSNQPYTYKTDKQIKEDQKAMRGAGDKMAADFFGTNYVGLPEGNKAKQQYIYDIYDYGDFGYGPGSQWDEELTEFFGGKPQGGFSHAQLTEYLYSIGAAGIDDSMFLGGNPGQIGFGPGEKPAWYGQPRTGSTGGGGGGYGGGDWGAGSGGGGGYGGGGGGGYSPPDDFTPRGRANEAWGAQNPLQQAMISIHGGQGFQQGFRRGGIVGLVT